jgi:hypothetical protein
MTSGAMSAISKFARNSRDARNSWDAGNHGDSSNIFQPKQRRDDVKSRESCNYMDVITAGTLETVWKMQQKECYQQQGRL